jgi:hypothetical protein
MEIREMRTSDRVCLETIIILSGTDSAGRRFVETTQAVVINRGGARITSRHALVPEQQLTIRCVKTGLEAAAQVAGPIVEGAEGWNFGVALLQPDVNIWGINFPLLDGTENPAGRVCLRCVDCHAQEVVHLDVFELGVLTANDCLTRPCKQCKETTLWRPYGREEQRFPVGRAAQGSHHKSQERRAPRVNLRVNVCVRHSVHGEEIVSTENVSRGGFRFISHKDYPLGTIIEAALPYSPGAANIFVPAKIVHEEARREEGTFAHGVACMPTSPASSLARLPVSPPK